MFYFLMHKDTQVALCKDGITVDVYKPDLLPIGAIKKGKTYDLSIWENQRKIPDTRINLNKFKKQYEIINKDNKLLAKCNYGLSLTDCYWFYEIDSSYLIIKLFLKLKLYNKKIPKYQSINYFDNPFNHGLFEKLLRNEKIDTADLNCPDLTTGGDTQKYWVYRNDKFYLVKENDRIYNFVAEKELLTSLIAYLINECRIEGKKSAINTISYQLEKGKTEEENCCYSEIFTTKEENLVTYEMLTYDNEKKPIDKISDFLSSHTNIKNLTDFIDFIIVLDFITENNRKEDDIGFILNNFSQQIIKCAPLYGNGKGLNYMSKDFTRANHQLYSSSHINVFGMDEEQQCRHIAENVKWLVPEMLYHKMDVLLEYLANADMSALPKEYKDNLADWIKYKIVMIANTRRQIAIAQEASEHNEEKRTSVNNNGEIIEENYSEEY